MTILISDSFSWFSKRGFNIHVPARTEEMPSVLQYVVVWSDHTGFWLQQRGPSFLKDKGIDDIPILCTTLVSFHSKLVLNAELGSPSSFSRGSLFDELDLSEWTVCPCELALGRQSEQSGLTWQWGWAGSVMPAFLLVTASVPTRRVHCKADPQAIQKPFTSS